MCGDLPGLLDDEKSKDDTCLCSIERAEPLPLLESCTARLASELAFEYVERGVALPPLESSLDVLGAAPFWADLPIGWISQLRRASNATQCS